MVEEQFWNQGRFLPMMINIARMFGGERVIMLALVAT